MVDFISLTCPTCGAALQITKDIERFSCSHCGNEHLVKRTGGIVSIAPITEGLRNIQTGTDRTAAELAYVRLKNDLKETELAIRQLFTLTTYQAESYGKSLRHLLKAQRKLSFWQTWVGLRDPEKVLIIVRTSTLPQINGLVDLHNKKDGATAEFLQKFQRLSKKRENVIKQLHETSIVLGMDEDASAVNSIPSSDSLINSARALQEIEPVIIKGIRSKSLSQADAFRFGKSCLFGFLVFFFTGLIGVAIAGPLDSTIFNISRDSDLRGPITRAVVPIALILGIGVIVDKLYLKSRFLTLITNKVKSIGIRNWFFNQSLVVKVIVATSLLAFCCLITIYITPGQNQSNSSFSATAQMGTALANLMLAQQTTDTANQTLTLAPIKTATETLLPQAATAIALETELAQVTLEHLASQTAVAANATATRMQFDKLTQPHADGDYFVGVDIAPGRWQVSSSPDNYCYWAWYNPSTEANDSGPLHGNGAPPFIVTIYPYSYEIVFESCGIIIYLGN